MGSVLGTKPGTEPLFCAAQTSSGKKLTAIPKSLWWSCGLLPY